MRKVNVRPRIHRSLERDKNKSPRSAKIHIDRVGFVLLPCLAGGLTGVLLAYFLGTGLTASGVREINGSLGTIEEIRLPAGTRTLQDIKTFLLKIQGPDDFGRVYVNNYLTISNEIFYTSNSKEGPPGNLFFRRTASAQKERDVVLSHAVNRQNFAETEKDIRSFLIHGRNYIVQELENATGPCTFTMDMVVNGTELENFPHAIPDQEFIDKGVRTTLSEKFAEGSEISKGLSGIDPFAGALCARHVWEVTLD
jgi:hypothetical protein